MVRSSIQGGGSQRNGGGLNVWACCSSGVATTAAYACLQASDWNMEESVVDRTYLTLSPKPYSITDEYRSPLRLPSPRALHVNLDYPPMGPGSRKY